LRRLSPGKPGFAGGFPARRNRGFLSAEIAAQPMISAD
jgi:hypothetical protein